MENCPWSLQNEFFRNYHDNEWCRPHHDDTYLFEMLILEGAHAGLSWLSILKRREAYKEAFFDFDIVKCAEMTDEIIEDQLKNFEIIRNRSKVESVRKNAKAVISIQKEYGSFSSYLLHFVNNKPVINHRTSEDQIPAQSELSQKIGKDLKKRGCSFVGPVIIYSFLQAAGIIDDHLITCPFHSDNRK